MSSQKPEINLLSQKSFEDTTIGRIMAWILTSFRIIVIITEIIVMVAFISRFWLDSKNTDLDEQIQNKQAIIAASSTFEQEFKNTQARLKALSEIISQPYKPSQVFEVITKQITPDSILTSVNFQNGQAEIAGTSPNEKDIQQFIINLFSSNYFDNVWLSDISTSQQNSNLLVYKLVIKYKASQNK